MGFIDLIRHGEPLGGHRYRGQTNDPLSEKGWEQMWSAVGTTAPWKRIITSPLQRCSAFAYALSEQYGIPINEEPQFKEVHFGIWEGRTAGELEAENPGVVTRFYHDPVHARPEGAESLEGFFHRISRAWEALAKEDIEQHTLLVAHAGTIRSIVGHLLSVPLLRLYRIAVPYAGVTRIELKNNKPPTILFHGASLKT